VTALPQPRTDEPLNDEAQADAPLHDETLHDAPLHDEPQADAPGAGAARPDRRSLALMLACSVLGAAVALLAAGQTWTRGEVSSFQQAVLHVSATGSQTTGVPSALALVGLASAVAVFAVRGFGRRLLGALLAVAGAGVMTVCVTAATGTAALDRRAGAAIGLGTATAGQVTHSVWPWAGVAGGALLVVAGVLVITRGRDWPGMSSRYDAPASRRVVGPGTAATAGPGRSRPQPERTPADVWKALDRGEDPTE
jgi:uncharacterized membrane protein (TIGR02234 family)